MNIDANTILCVQNITETLCKYLLKECINSIISSYASNANFQLKPTATIHKNGSAICSKTQKYLNPFQTFVETDECSNLA